MTDTEFKEAKRKAIDEQLKVIKQCKKDLWKAWAMSFLPGPGWFKRQMMYRLHAIWYGCAIMSLQCIQSQIPLPPPTLFMEQGGVVSNGFFKADHPENRE